MMATEKQPHEHHRERMRTRLSVNGFEHYQPHEVLEQLLFYCRPRVNTNEIGHALIERFGSVKAVLNADKKELMKVNGVGEKTADAISSIKDTVASSIKEQYRQMPPLTRAGVVFLADFFFREGDSSVGVILCDFDGIFKDCFTLSEDEHSCFRLSDEGFAELLLNKCGTGKCILVYNRGQEPLVSDVYRLIDRILPSGLTVSNVYARDKRRYFSLLRKQE